MLNAVFSKNLTHFLDIVGWSTSSLRRSHELPKVIPGQLWKNLI